MASQRRDNACDKRFAFVVSKSMKGPDPYRLFFPLGIVLGLGGVAIWPLFYFGVLTGYWGISHAFLQSNGFLFCFISGFLLTAVPRFTGTKVPSLLWQWTLAAMVIWGAIALELQYYQMAQTVFAGAYIVLLVLVLSRFLKRESGALPETFSLIGTALLTGTIGALLNAVAFWNIDIGGWALAGKRALTEGMTLVLVLGVGGFLGPRLLGFDRLPVVQIVGLEDEHVRSQAISKRTIYTVVGVLLAISLFVQYGIGIPWMSFVRAGVASYVLFTTVNPWRKPAHRTTLAWCVWTSIWITMLGLWLVAFVPKYQVDFLHVLFIGGFSLIILAVGMRVTLSHGGHGLTSEKKNWPLRIGLITGLIA